MKILFAGEITVSFGKEKKLAQLIKEGNRFVYISPFTGERVSIGGIKKLVKRTLKPNLSVDENTKQRVSAPFPPSDYPDGIKFSVRPFNKIPTNGGTKESVSPRQLLFNAQNGLCHYCGKLTPFNKWTIDHLTPIARGGRKGRHTSNVTGACSTCNHAKGSMTYEEFMVTDYLSQERRQWLGFNEEPQLTFRDAKHEHILRMRKQVVPTKGEKLEEVGPFKYGL